jgi:hypothetical protein
MVFYSTSIYLLAWQDLTVHASVPIIYYIRLQILSANVVLLVEMAGVGGVSHGGGRRYLGG